MKAKYLTTTTTIITIFFGLNINLLSSLCIIIKIHISSKPLIMVTKKKYHNVNGNYNHKILDFDKKKKKYHNMTSNSNISNKGSPRIEASHILML